MRLEVAKRALARRKTPGRYAGFIRRKSESKSRKNKKRYHSRSRSSDSYSNRRRKHHKLYILLYSGTVQKDTPEEIDRLPGQMIGIAGTDQAAVQVSTEGEDDNI